VTLTIAVCMCSPRVLMCDGDAGHMARARGQMREAGVNKVVVA
jgi:hypothetical protein